MFSHGGCGFHDGFCPMQSLGSKWSSVPSTQETFTFVDSDSGKTLATRVETPPNGALRKQWVAMKQPASDASVLQLHAATMRSCALMSGTDGAPCCVAAPLGATNFLLGEQKGSGAHSGCFGSTFRPKPGWLECM